VGLSDESCDALQDATYCARSGHDEQKELWRRLEQVKLPADAHNTEVSRRGGCTCPVQRRRTEPASRFDATHVPAAVHDLDLGLVLMPASPLDY